MKVRLIQIITAKNLNLLVKWCYLYQNNSRI